MRRNNSTLWGLAAAILTLVSCALYQADNPQQTLEDSNEWPTMAPAAPSADNFEAFNDGRPAPGEAIIGLNEIGYQQTANANANCPDGRCPNVTPALYQPNYQPAYQPPQQAYTLPSGYVANNYGQPQQVYYQQTQPVYYSQPTYYSSGDCDCENCNCAGARRLPLFPIARRVGGFVLRGTARIVSAPFRWRRRALENW